MKGAPTASTPGGIARLALLLPLALFGVALIRTAWLCDDAWISFRSVDNLLAGYGPVWNPGDRVQSFTHPLWFVLMIPIRAATGEFHLSVMIFSMGLSLAAVALAGYSGGSPLRRRVLLLALCCASRAFVDYSTSGLENPLTHLLLVAFVVLYVGGRENRRPSVPLLVLLASLGVLTRHDTLLIYAPPLALEIVRQMGFLGMGGGASAEAKPWRLLGLLALGSLPLVAWEIFSVVYYGFPFPNTAYAKLNTGIPRVELIEQGLYYVGFCLENDPLTLVVIVMGLVAGFAEKDGSLRALALGIGLYLAYVVWIGGDFMAGRFFALPFWGALLILLNATLAPVPVSARWIGGGLLTVIAVIATFWMTPPAPLLSGPGYPNRKENTLHYDWRGIGDERSGYYPWTGLTRAEPERRSPEQHPWAQLGAQLRADAPDVYVMNALGFAGWMAGTSGHILDPNALSDPLLARLPAMREPRWHIGHFTRAMPPGYLATLVLGENRIADPGVAAAYDDLRLITRGPLFSNERMRAILRMNLGGGPDPDNPEYFLSPPGHPVPARRHYRAERFDSRMGEPPIPGSDSFALYWNEVGHERALEMVTPDPLVYDLQVARGGVELGHWTASVGPAQASVGSSTETFRHALEIPEAWAAAGYDTVRFFPRGGGAPQRIESIRRVAP